METLKKYQYIDETRGLAILLVILVHTAQSVGDLGLFKIVPAYGQMGVQLFFVASAFTLCHSFTSRKNEPQAVTSFYLRRFFRIAPMYYVGIIIYFLLLVLPQALKSQPIDFHQYVPENIISNILFIHGFVPAANNNIVFGGWSIGTEMAFYALFPILCFFLLQTEKATLKRILIFISIVCVTSFVSQFALTKLTDLNFSNNSFLYFNIINQLAVFLFGVLLYSYLKLYPESKLLSSKRYSLLLFVILTGASLFCWLVWQSKWAFFFVPLLSGASFIFLINMLRLKSKGIDWLAQLGRASYSMYIFHFLFAWNLVPGIMKNVFPDFHPLLKLAISIPLVTLLSFWIASISEKCIEATGISIGSRLISKIQNSTKASN